MTVIVKVKHLNRELFFLICLCLIFGLAIPPVVYSSPLTPPTQESAVSSEEQAVSVAEYKRRQSQRSVIRSNPGLPDMYTSSQSTVPGPALRPAESQKPEETRQDPDTQKPDWANIQQENDDLIEAITETNEEIAAVRKKVQESTKSVEELEAALNGILEVRENLPAGEEAQKSGEEELLAAIDEELAALYQSYQKLGELQEELDGLLLQARQRNEEIEVAMGIQSGSMALAASIVEDIAEDLGRVFEIRDEIDPLGDEVDSYFKRYRKWVKRYLQRLKDFLRRLVENYVNSDAEELIYIRSYINAVDQALKAVEHSSNPEIVIVPKLRSIKT